MNCFFQLVVSEPSFSSLYNNPCKRPGPIVFHAFMIVTIIQTRTTRSRLVVKTDTKYQAIKRKGTSTGITRWDGSHGKHQESAGNHPGMIGTGLDHPLIVRGEAESS